jgi:hypothetical protein
LPGQIVEGVRHQSLAKSGEEGPQKADSQGLGVKKTLKTSQIERLEIPSHLASLPRRTGLGRSKDHSRHWCAIALGTKTEPPGKFSFGNLALGVGVVRRGVSRLNYLLRLTTMSKQFAWYGQSGNQYDTGTAQSSETFFGFLESNFNSERHRRSRYRCEFVTYYFMKRLGRLRTLWITPCANGKERVVFDGLTVGRRLIGAEALGSRATVAEATGAVALAVLALGGLAVGFLAIGRLIVRQILVKEVHLRHLKIDQLEVEDLRVGKLTMEQEKRSLGTPEHPPTA